MNERITNVIRHPLTIPITVGVASFGAGVGLGYILARKTGKDAELYEIPQVELGLTEDDLEEMQEEFLEAMDEAHDAAEELIRLHKDTPISAVLADENAPEEISAVVEVDGEKFEAEDEEHLKVVGTPPEVTPVQRNAFAGSDGEWDYEAEVRNRTTDRPHILHKDEFYADEKEYTQMSLTYYAGDNIMVDEEEVPIYNHERTVGPLRFGHGSGDPNVFYVRNDKLKAEYEIIRASGLYSVDVLGYQIEDNERVKDLKHMHEPPKFRRE